LGEEVIVEVIVIEVKEVVVLDLISAVLRFVGAAAVALIPQLLAELLLEARTRARRLLNVLLLDSDVQVGDVRGRLLASKASLAAIFTARSSSGKRSRTIHLNLTQVARWSTIVFGVSFTSEGGVL
jgi:hypothetical protein